MDQVKHHIIRATELTALSVSRLIQEQGFTSEDLLTEEESFKREKLIDQAGVDAMYATLADLPFTLKVVGSEGRKHIHQYGEALPTLMGTFGPAPYGAGLRLDMVNDVVEGSKAAKLNSPGAVSVIAVSTHKGLMVTPDDIDYMDKLFGPSQLKGRISMRNSVEENLTEVVDSFRINPSEINVVIMDRDRNAHYINACQKFGVNLILIKAGDFMPSILSFLDPKKHKKGIHLIMGSGGFEEGVMAAVAAKALGAFCEAKGWSGDKEIQNKYKMIWSIDDLVPGKKEDCLVSISTITDEDKWFKLKGVENVDNGHKVTSLIVDRKGLNIDTKVHN